MRKKINKYVVLALFVLVCGFSLLPKCFAKEKMIFSVTGSSMAETDFQNYRSPGIKLAPGVYQIRIYNDNLPQEGVMSAMLACPTAFHRALLGNTVFISGGQEQQDFEVYVLNTLEGVRLECNITNADFDCISEISVYKMNWGARMLLYLLIFFGGIVCAAMRFRDMVFSKRIPKTRQIVVWALLAGIIIAYIPWLCDYFTAGDDSVYQMLRIEGLKETLLHGNQFPIRVQDYFLYGHGYINSIFNSDFFLYFPAALRIIGFPLMFAVKAYLLFILAVHAVISFHCLYQCTENDYAALLGSFCTLLSPYHLHIIYNRGALGEYTAMAFLPLVIAGMFLLYTKDVAAPEYKRYKWYLILGLSALLQCYLIVFAISIIMILVFCLIHMKKTLRRHTFVQLVQAVVAILLINCFFWLPLLYMMGSDIFAFHSLTEETIQEKGISLAHLLQLVVNKGGAQIGMYNAEALHPGAALLFALFAFGLYGFKFRKKAYGKYVISFFGWIVAILLLSSKYFPWNALKAVPVLNVLTSFIQFPYKLLAPAIMLGGFFLAFFYLWMSQSFSDWVKKGCYCFLIALCLISAIYQVNDIAFSSMPIRLYSTENMGHAFVGRGEYLLEGSDVLHYHYHGPAADEHITWSDYEKKGSQIRMNVTNSSSMTEYIELPLTGYKGYEVTSPLSIEGKEGRGFNNDLRIAVPGGYSGEVTVRYRELPLWQAADFISLLSILVLSGYGIFKRFYRRKEIC